MDRCCLGTVVKWQHVLHDFGWKDEGIMAKLLGTSLDTIKLYCKRKSENELGWFDKGFKVCSKLTTCSPRFGQ